MVKIVAPNLYCDYKFIDVKKAIFCALCFELEMAILLWCGELCCFFNNYNIFLLRSNENSIIRVHTETIRGEVTVVIIYQLG